MASDINNPMSMTISLFDEQGNARVINYALLS